MHDYDEAVLDCFLEQQLKLFPQSVADSREEAEAFLEDCLAVVVSSAKEVREYLEEEGLDPGDGDGGPGRESDGEPHRRADGRTADGAAGRADATVRRGI